MAANDGGPVFPTEWRNDGDRNASAPDGEVVPPGGSVMLPGMSLRAWLAGQALIGELASQSDDSPWTDKAKCADRCVGFADAIIERLRK